MREGRTVGCMFGASIGGDALDIFDDLVVTGSNRNKEVVQLYSLS